MRPSPRFLSKPVWIQAHALPNYGAHLLSRQPVQRMALVMPHEHDSHIFGASFVKEMVGKALEVRPPEALVRQMKPQRILRRSIDGGPQLCVEFVGEPGRDILLIG